MALLALWTQLSSDFDTLSPHFRSFAAAKNSISSSEQFSLHDECLLEGLLSRVWQTWCRFCRSSVCESCLGTTSASGQIVPPLPQATSEGHVSAAAINAKKNCSKVWGGTNNSLRREPTWGKADDLITIIAELGPANKNQLLAAFSTGHQSAEALRLIRNAAAHNNSETITEVHDMRSRYLVFSITHPIQALFWTQPKSRDFLVLHAIQELRDAALNAVS